MQTSRLPLHFAVVLNLGLSLGLVVVGAGCNSTSTPSTTSGGGNGSGNGSGTGDGNATGNNPTTGASSGSSSGGQSSTGSSSGGEDPIGTQCSKVGNTDYMTCSTSLDCMCPKQVCALDSVLGGDDAGGSICTLPCTTTKDCPNIFTSCQDGLCVTNICEADGGGGAFMGPCDAEGQGDGTCEPSYSITSQDYIGVCFQAGTVKLDGGRCDPNQAAFAIASEMNKSRPKASDLCPVGYQCSGGSCTQLCDPIADTMTDNDAGACLDGQDCLPIGNETPFGGYCTVVGDGGCNVGQGGTELMDCSLTACECPLECEIDFVSLRHVCEQTCKTTADCDIPFTNCQRDGYCNYNYCVQTYYGQPVEWLPDAGSYGGPCNLAGIGDGLCQPEFDQTMFGNFGPFGYCEPAGTLPLGGACGNPPFCGEDAICIGTGGPTGNCLPLCQPFLDGGNGGCEKSTDGCFTVIAPPLEQVAGFCQACTTATNPCYNSPECCDGYCAYAQPDAGNGFCN